MPKKLKYSEKLLIYPDGSLEEKTLVDLLEEGHIKKIRGDEKVFVTRRERKPEIRPEDFVPVDENYRDVRDSVKVDDLYKWWNSLPGAGASGRYSPENEEERSSFQREWLRGVYVARKMLPILRQAQYALGLIDECRRKIK